MKSSFFITTGAFISLELNAISSIMMTYAQKRSAETKNERLDILKIVKLEISVNVSTSKYLLGIFARHEDTKYEELIIKQNLTIEIEAHNKDVIELKVEILDLKETQGI